jgi:hypothetical protein
MSDDQESEYEANFNPEEADLFYEIPATPECAETVFWIAYCTNEQRAITMWHPDLSRVQRAAIDHQVGHTVQIYSRVV